jgi:hypothetical protein
VINVDCDADSAADAGLVSKAVAAATSGDQVFVSGYCANQTIPIVFHTDHVVLRGSSAADTVIDGRVIVDGAQNIRLVNFSINYDFPGIDTHPAILITNRGMARLNFLNISSDRDAPAVIAVNQNSGRTLVFGTNVRANASNGNATGVLLASNAVYVSTYAANSVEATATGRAIGLNLVLGAAAYSSLGDVYTANGLESSAAYSIASEGSMRQLDDANGVGSVTINGDIEATNATLLMRSTTLNGNMTAENSDISIIPAHTFSSGNFDVKGGALLFSTPVQIDANTDASLNSVITVDGGTNLSGRIFLRRGARALITGNSTVDEICTIGHSRESLIIDNGSEVVHLNRENETSAKTEKFQPSPSS